MKSSSKENSDLKLLAKYLVYLIESCKETPDGQVYEVKQLVGRINGLTMHIYSNEHNPPHFHVKYAEKEASYMIDSCELLNGSLGNREDKIVKYFHNGTKEKLLKIWNDTRPGECAVGSATLT